MKPVWDFGRPGINQQCGKKILYVWVSQDTCALSQLKNLVWTVKEGLKHPSCLLRELKCRRRSCAGFCTQRTSPLGAFCCGWELSGLQVHARELERLCTKLETSWLSLNVEGIGAGLQGSRRSKCRGGRWCLGGHWKDSIGKPVLMLSPLTCLDSSFSPTLAGLIPTLSVLRNTNRRKSRTYLCLACIAVINQ